MFHVPKDSVFSGSSYNRNNPEGSLALGLGGDGIGEGATSGMLASSDIFSPSENNYHRNSSSSSLSSYRAPPRASYWNGERLDNHRGMMGIGIERVNSNPDRRQKVSNARAMELAQRFEASTRHQRDHLSLNPRKVVGTVKKVEYTGSPSLSMAGPLDPRKSKLSSSKSLSSRRSSYGDSRSEVCAVGSSGEMTVVSSNVEKSASLQKQESRARAIAGSKAKTERVSSGPTFIQPSAETSQEAIQNYKERSTEVAKVQKRRLKSFGLFRSKARTQNDLPAIC